MKILTGRQIREADRVTIEREGISSLELMERAAERIARWISDNVALRRKLLFFCGKGGNAGDGLAAARILARAGRECAVFLAAAPDELAADTRANLARLPEVVAVFDITVERPDIEPDAVIVDALLGVGAAGEVREPLKSIIEWINLLPNRVISIDIPSGMQANQNQDTGQGSAGAATVVRSAGRTTVCNAGKTTVVCAETTLTIEFPKLPMLLPETGECTGRVVVLPIGLDEKFLAEAETPYYYITEEWVADLCLPRAKFTHKGSYGHVLLVCGSAAMPGAAILATGGALRSGCGLVTVHIPRAERFALTANHHSAMLSLDGAECFSTLPDRLERFSAIGVGCGLGRDEKTTHALEELLTAASSLTPANPSAAFGERERPRGIPMVSDADALNIIAENARLKQLIPAGSVMTPHPGELRRLVGEWADDCEKLEKASKLASETDCVVVIKGAHSVVCTPDGRFLFNSTGTPGMAKGGSGDVLTGFVTGLMARGYSAENASITAVYAHGRAGERAAKLYGEEAMNASDLADFLGTTAATDSTARK